MKNLKLNKNTELLHLEGDLSSLQVEAGVEASVVWDLTKVQLSRLQLEAGAKLSLLCVYPSEYEANIDLKTECLLADDAQLEVVQVYLGGQQVKVDFKTIMSGNRAVSNIYVIYFARDTQDFDFTISTKYEGENNYGETIIKGIVCGCAKVNVDGVIEIAKTGKRSEASLSERALLLSKEAQVRHLPTLKIDTDDVRASHAASISRININDMFYLQSRGLPDDLAQKLLIEAFLADVYRRDKVFEGYFCTIERDIEGRISA